MADISDSVQDEDFVSDRRSFLVKMMTILGATAAVAFPLRDADARGGWNISYGLAKGENALVSLGKKYDKIRQTLNPSLVDKLVIEKSTKGNYFLVLKINTSANRAQRVINASKRKGIDAALRRYCNCEVAFPLKAAPAGIQQQKPLQKPIAPAEQLRQRTRPRHLPQPRPQPARTRTYSPSGARFINHPDYVRYSSLDLNNLESVLQRQFAHEKQRGNISQNDVLYAYVEAGYDMPVLTRSNSRIKGIWTSAESFADKVQDADFYAAIRRISPSKSGVLISALPQGARLRGSSKRSRDFIAEGAVIYAKNLADSYSQQYVVVIGIKGSSSNHQKNVAISRLSCIVYEAMRSKYAIE